MKSDSSTSAVAVERPERTSSTSAPTCTIQPTSPSAEQAMSRAPSGRRVAVAAVSTRLTSAGALRPSAAPSSGRAVAAPSAPPTTPQSRPSPKALPAEGETLAASLLPPRTAKASMSRPNGKPTTAAQAMRAAGRAPSVRCSCQRVASATAPIGMATKIIGATRPDAELSGPVSTTGASNVLTAWRKASLTTPPPRPTSPMIDASGVASAMIRPATSTAPAAASAASPAATTPGTASWPTSNSESSPAWGSTRPMRSRSGSVRGGGARAAGSATGGSSGAPASGSGSASASARSSSAAGGSGTATGSASTSGSLTRKSSWRAPQDGQNRERTLMRSPQLAQNLVSVPAISPPPPPCVRWPQGVVSLRGDGRRGSQAPRARGLLGRDVRRRAAPHGRRGAEPAGRHAQDPPRLRRLRLDGGRRRRGHAQDPGRAGRRGRPAGLAAALDAGRAARLRRHEALAPHRARLPRLEPRPAHRPAGSLAGRAADPLVQGQGPHADRLRPRAGRAGPRDLWAAHDHPRLRRQGHLSAALAVPGRAAHRQGRRRDAHPGDRVQGRPGGAARAEVHRGGGRRRLRRCGQRPDAQGAAARPLHARAAQVRPEGQARARRPERAPGDRDRPGPLPRRHAPRLRALVRRRAAPGGDAEGQRVVDRAAPRHRRPRADGARQRRHRNPELRDPRPPELLFGGLRLRAPGLRQRLRRRVAPDRRRRPGRLQPAVLPARSLLHQARAQGLQREGPLQRHRRSALSGRARRRGPRPPRRRPGSDEGPAAQGPQRPHARRRGLAQRAARDGPARPRRRRPGRARLRRRRGAAAQEGVVRRALAILVVTLALPAPALAQGGAAKPVVGGGSFNTAPLLGPGTYDDTVAAGETVYWKVRLAKGQVLRVKATVDTSQIQTDPLADGFDKGLANLTYFLDIFSPLREQLSEESGGTYDAASARLEGSAAAGAKTGTATGPRVLGFEQILASDYNEDKFPAPGEWYVSLNAADSATFPAEVPAELPVELEVEVVGQAQPSSPDFAQALPGPQKQQPAAPDTASGPERLFATADQPADPALTLALVAVLALLGGLVLGTLAILGLGLGRRRT